MAIRYNYYRMQRPDLNNSNVRYDLPECEYTPKQSPPARMQVEPHDLRLEKRSA